MTVPSLESGQSDQGARWGQAYADVSSSTSSSLLAVAAQGLPGPEAVFVLLCLIALGGLLLD